MTAPMAREGAEIGHGWSRGGLLTRGVVAASLGGALVLGACTAHTTKAGLGAVAASTSWQLPADTAAAVARAGLPMFGQEMLAVHDHAHLDVLVTGAAIRVPAGLGIDRQRQQISPLHTHDASGVIHIESPNHRPYTLGQLFLEWGQPLSPQQIGPHRLTSSEVLRVFRNGHQVTGDPAALRLAPHDEVVVWVGPSTAHPAVPSSYTFPQGL